MNKNFIKKLETEKFLIGSFDAYQENSKSLIKNNSNLSEEEIELILKSMPTAYRAAITNKNDEYIGYIGLFNVDAQNSIASIRFETVTSLIQDDKDEILSKYKKYLGDFLNITDIDEFIYRSNDKVEIEKKEISPKSNIIIPNKMLVPGVTEEILQKFSNDYQIPKLQMPFTIKSNDKVIGIIGLSNLIWSNKRANLNLFLEKKLGNDIIDELSGYLIDDYINYVHELNVHNVSLSINASDNNMINLINSTNMNYYAQIPFGTIVGNNIESKLMFQHIPNMERKNRIIIPDNKAVSLSTLDTDKKELSEYIELDNGFKLVSPKAFEDRNINFDKVLEGHIKAMQDRKSFTIPLGEDKYFLQKGNGNYGLSKELSNYSYIVLNENNDYSGYINILRNNANGKNAEIEIGIDPNQQHRGLGTSVINRFYDELFSVGYASVTSAVFDFNNPSMKLHEKVAEFNGVRLDSYYVNGRLWNMNFYSKINSTISQKK